MEKSMMKLVEEISGQALVCETVAQDFNEQALTGESRLKEKYETEARAWQLKASVWREAELLARTFLDPAEAPHPSVPNPIEAPGNVRSESLRYLAVTR